MMGHQLTLALDDPMQFIAVILINKSSGMIGALVALFVIFVGVRNGNRFR